MTSLTLTVREVHGYFAGQIAVLGQYTMQVTAAHGTLVQGIHLAHPLTIIYHYDPVVLADLGLDAGTLLLSWPELAAAARKAHTPWQPNIIALHDNPKAQTLTAQSTVIANGPFDEGGGNPDNASPPVPDMGAVQGNSGQFSYAYPLTVAPGPEGTVPQLSLTYSSAATNARHNQASPANDFGEGWTLSLGSITAQEYPSNGAGGAGTWYSISGVDNVSDMLVPNTNDKTIFATLHYSHSAFARPPAPTPAGSPVSMSGIPPVPSTSSAATPTRCNTIPTRAAPATTTSGISPPSFPPTMAPAPPDAS